LFTSSQKKGGYAASHNSGNGVLCSYTSCEPRADGWQDVRIVVGQHNRSNISQPWFRIFKADVVIEMRNQNGQLSIIFSGFKNPNIFVRGSRDS